MRPKPIPEPNSRNVEEIIIPPAKREVILIELRQVLQNVKLQNIYILLKNSFVPNCVTRKWVEVNDLSKGQYSVKKSIRFKTPMLQ